MAYLVGMPKAAWKRQPTGAVELNPHHWLASDIYAGVSYAGGNEYLYRCSRTESRPNFETGVDFNGNPVIGVKIPAVIVNYPLDVIVNNDTDHFAVLALVRRGRNTTTNRNMVFVINSGPAIAEDDDNIIGNVPSRVSLSKPGNAINNLCFLSAAACWRPGVGLTYFLQGTSVIFGASADTNLYGGNNYIHTIQLGAGDINSGWASEFWFLRVPITDDVIIDWINFPYQIYRPRIARFILIPSSSSTVNSVTANIDALLKKSFVQSLSVDALLRKTFESTVSVDALIQAVKTGVISLDALAQSTKTVNVSVDALLQAVQENTLSLDAFLQIVLSQYVSLDALLQAAKIANVDIDALIQQPYTQTALLDALIQAAQSNTLGLDADIGRVE